MSVFHGDRNEDPKEFLSTYLQCTAAGDNNFKARQFINYLGADSDADEWYDELPQEEKKDWTAIEISFRKRWLKEEVISIIKATVPIENKLELQPASETIHPTLPINAFVTRTGPPATILQSTTDSLVQTNPIKIQTNGYVVQLPLTSPTLLPAILPATTDTMATQTETLTSQHLQNGPPIHVVSTSQSPAPLPGNGEKNTKFGKIQSKISIFTSPKPSATAANSLSPTSTFTALETRSTTAGFAKNQLKVENSSIFTPTTSKTPSLSISRPTNDGTRVHASPHTHDNVILHPPSAPMLGTTASSPHTPPVSGHEKSVHLHAVFESQTPTEYPEPTAVSTVFETRSDTAVFINNRQNHPKSPVLNQNHPKLLVLNQNATDFQTTTTYGTPFIPATYFDEEITGFEVPFPPFHNLFVATSQLPALFDYVSNAKADSTFEKSTPSSGKDPPHSLSLLYHSHKNFNIFPKHISSLSNTVYSTFFVLSPFYTKLLPFPSLPHVHTYLVTHSRSFVFAFCFCSCFQATRALPCLRGGTWSIGPPPSPPAISQPYHVT